MQQPFVVRERQPVDGHGRPDGWGRDPVRVLAREDQRRLPNDWPARPAQDPAVLVAHDPRRLLHPPEELDPLDHGWALWEPDGAQRRSVVVGVVVVGERPREDPREARHHPYPCPCPGAGLRALARTVLSAALDRWRLVLLAIHLDPDPVPLELLVRPRLPTFFAHERRVLDARAPAEHGEQEGEIDEPADDAEGDLQPEQELRPGRIG